MLVGYMPKIKNKIKKRVEIRVESVKFTPKTLLILSLIHNY